MGLAVMSALKLAVFLVSLVSLCSAQSCSDFSEGLCPLSEDNIVGSIVSPNVEECQSTCRSNADCNFFSFIGTQCFHLSSCETTEPCPGCMSGPPLPDISECQESTTEAPMTTEPSTESTTTNMPTDTTMTTTTTPMTTTNTTMTTTTTPMT